MLNYTNEEQTKIVMETKHISNELECYYKISENYIKINYYTKIYFRKLRFIQFDFERSPNNIHVFPWPRGR